VDVYWTARRLGKSQKGAAADAHFSVSYAQKLEHQARNGDEALVERREKDLENPIPLDEVCAEALAALNDRTGVLWCRRYWGYELSGWQQEFWRILEDGWDSDDREFLLLNAPPGGGKSTVMVMFASKLIARDRGVRLLFMSRAHKLAVNNTRRLRNTLQRTSPASNKDGSEALATLGVDFGRFRPKIGGGDVWRAEEWTVVQMDGTAPEEKEPTCAAYGFDSLWIGNRLDGLFGDDLDVSRLIRNMDVVEGNRVTFDNELEPRVDQGGLLCLTQQRLGAFDFSAHVKSKMVLPDDDDGEGELLVPKYRQTAFKAHYDELCKGSESHRVSAPGWPDGCLLDPRNLPWRDVKRAMANPEVFKVVYQQEDPSESESLVQQIWVEGGRGEDGREYVGCWDKGRAGWEIPPSTPLPHFGVVTVDPSPTRYWSVQAWHLAAGSELRWLLEQHRERMEAPDFLDWSTTLGDWTGLAEDYRKLYLRAGGRLTHLIVERNAAQRFMLQYDHFHRWRQAHGVQLIAHDTHTNKADAEFGVQMIGPRWRDGQVRLPGAGMGRISSMRLVDEVTRYPYAPTDDCVMGQWFLEHNAANLGRRLNRKPKQPWRPSWGRQTAKV
jgi:hypothetical protein